MKGVAYKNVIGTEFRPKQAGLNKIDRIKSLILFYKKQC